MSAGLRIWSSTGVLLQDPSNRIGTLLGVTTTTKNNGSITDARFAQGTPAVFKVLPSTNARIFIPPKVTFSGNTMSWTFNTPGAAGNSPVRIMYGIY